ncbi:MAG: hypothetical protein P9M14_13275 [Candidatus Alcyoniella australis]|nr:hypothetical protein [Candidatus Alcyoniella australis]
MNQRRSILLWLLLIAPAALLLCLGCAGDDDDDLDDDDAASWHSMDSPSASHLFELWGADANNVFAGGGADDAPMILRYDGTQWTQQQVGDDLPQASVSCIWGRASDDVHAIGDFGNGASLFWLHYDGAQWTQQQLDEAIDEPFNATQALPAGRAVAVTSRVFEFDGQDWSAIYGETHDAALLDIWADDAQVFAVGAQGRIAHFDGANWSEHSVGNDYILYGVWGASGDDVYAVGQGADSSAIFHFNGASWSALRELEFVPADIWGASADQIFVVGLGGNILHFDGATWSAMDSGVSEGLQAIWGASADDVFASGLNGTLLHYCN